MEEDIKGHPGQDTVAQEVSQGPTIDKKIEITVMSNGDLTLGLSKQNFKNHEFYGMLIATMVELIVSNLKNELLNSFGALLQNMQAPSEPVKADPEREAVLEKINSLKSQLEGLVKNI